MKKFMRFFTFVLFAVFSFNMTVYGNQPTGCISLSNEHTDYKIPEKSSVSNNDASSYLTLIDENNLLEESVKNNIIKVFNEIYYDVFDYYNDGIYINVKIEVIEISGNPAYTIGNCISVDYNYMNSYKEDYDIITHELVHVAQLYNNNYMSTVPLWLTEGIADYGRNQFGINNPAASWELSAPKISDYYSDAYKTTAAFLVWIDNNYSNFSVQALNKAIKQGKYSASYIETITEKNYDELWIEYLEDNNIHFNEIDLTLPEVTPISPDVDIMSYLTIENVNNSATEDMINDIKTVFSKTFADICTHFNNGKLLPLTVRFEPENGNVAYTDCAQGLIVINSQYLANNPEDYDCFTHELVHLAQNYQNSNPPGWLVEGIADYGRNIYGLNNETANWSIPFYTSNIYDGYKDTASFLLWVEEQYKCDLVKILNHLMKTNTYSPIAWKKITGYYLSELEKQFLDFTPINLKKPGDTISDLTFYDKNGQKVHLYDYSGPSVMIYGHWDSTNIKNEMDYAIEIKKIMGDKINVIFVFGNQSRSTFYSLLKTEGYIEKDYENIIILEDPNIFSILKSFSVVTETGYLLGWPGYAFITQDHRVAFSSVFGGYEQYNLSGNDYQLNIRKILAQCYPAYADKLISEENSEPDEQPQEPQIQRKIGELVLDNKVTYKITSLKKNKKTVSICALNKKARVFYIPNAIYIDNEEFKVTSIEKNAFKNHKNLNSVFFNDYVTTIGANAFYGCKKLNFVSFGKKLKTIGNSAFKNCTALTYIEISKSIQKIGSSAFYGCKKLKKVDVKSKKLTSVGKNALKGIHKKCKIYVPKAKYKAYTKLFKNKGQKKSVKIKKM